MCIIETIRKLEKVVKAVPRMESFITSITRHLSEDQQNPVEIGLQAMSLQLDETRHRVA